MLITYLVIIFATGLVVGVASSRGLERALPIATFFFVLIPRDAGIPLPGLFDLTAQRVILVALGVLYVVLPKKASDNKGSRTPLMGIILLHVVWCSISSAGSIGPMASVKKMVSEVFEYYLLYYVYFHTIRDERTINRILTSVVAAMGVASVFGTIESYWNWTVMEWFPSVSHHFDNWGTVGAASGRDARVTSTFAHAILFGAGLVIAIPIALYLLKIADRTRDKVLLWGALLLMFLTIYKTSSRGPWLGLILSLGIILVADKGKVKRYLIVILLLTASVLIIRPGVWETIANIYYGSTDPNSPLGSSYEYRYALRRVASKALSASTGRAIFGYGLESFFDLHLTGDLLGKPYPFLSCDSAWIEAMVETGYGGVAILAVLLMAPAWRNWKDFRSLGKGQRDLSLYMLVNMIAYYLMMLSVAMYGWGQTGYMLWIIIAISEAHSRIARGNKIGRGKSARLQSGRPVPEFNRMSATARWRLVQTEDSER